MNQYPLENLTWQEFEELVILICQEILGIAAQKFADGKDGARDSSFNGDCKSRRDISFRAGISRPQATGYSGMY